jgi:hypothetical protein
MDIIMDISVFEAGIGKGGLGGPPSFNHHQFLDPYYFNKIIFLVSMNVPAVSR